MQTTRRLGWLDYFLMNAYFLGLGFMWNSIHRFILPALLPLIVGVAVQASAYSALTTAGLIIAIIVQPISGAISDRSLSRYGRRRPMMALWTLVDLVFIAGLAFAPDFIFLFIVYCGLQFSSNMAHGPAQGLIPDLVPEEHRGAASGVKGFTDNLTLILAGFLTARVLLSLSPDLWESSRLALLAVGSLLILFLAVTTFTTRETPITREQLPREALSESIMRSLVVIGNITEIIRENRAYAWLLLDRLMFISAVNIVSNFGQFYFKDVVLVGNPNAAQLAPGLMGTLLIIVAVMLVVVSVPAGVLSDRFGRKPVSAAGAVIAGAGAVFLPFVRNAPLFDISALTDLTAVGLFVGVGVGIYFAANWAWATDLIADRDAARYLGISNLATAGGGVIANIGGPIIDLGNQQAFGLGYSIAFMIGALWFLISLLLLPLIRETRGVKAR